MKQKERCDKFYFLSKNTNNTQVRDKYKTVKNQYRKEINNTKLLYNNSLVSKALNKPKQIWNIIRGNITSTNKATNSFTTLIASGFNDFFICCVDDVIKKIPSSNHNPDYYKLNAYKSPTICCCFTLHFVSVEDVHSAVLSLSSSNCLDIYNTNSSILKFSSYYISQVVCHIINDFFDVGCFPDKLNVTKGIPLHKKKKITIV